MFSKKSISLLALGALLVGCGLSINGVLQVTSPLVFVKKSFFGSKTINVPVGSYNANVNVSDKEVTLSFKDHEGQKQSIDFKVPSGNFPTDGSWVRVPSTQTGQKYDVLASILKQVEIDDEIHRDWESCTYQRCYTHCSGSGQDRRCWQECQTHHGERRVEYRYVYTDWNLKVKLQESRQVASFAGERHDVTRDYLYQGTCH